MMVLVLLVTLCTLAFLMFSRHAVRALFVGEHLPLRDALDGSCPTLRSGSTTETLSNSASAAFG
jgi:hypothetical protein